MKKIFIYCAILFLFCINCKAYASDSLAVYRWTRPMQENFLTTSDNIKIAVNCYNSGHKDVLIIAHGWFMTKDSGVFQDLSERFAQNFDVITLDFRGHGDSSGAYTFSAKETKDLAAVVNYAKKHYEKVYIIGFSLGAATTLIYTAKENNVDKIIVVSPPSSFEKIENHMWRKEAWLPTLKKFEFKRYLSVRPDLKMYKKTAPIDVVNKITVPTMFIAGDHDPTVYPWHTENLYEKAVCQKKLKLFKDGTHAEDLYLEDKDYFVQICTDWFKQQD
ncbi:MAG: alpha/beta hydrolase [Candidatus Gastranaerophilales bacterium]|nr:alpha/beta hydrolase [Candidatus Gastranaerophilales bacterium]